jgi:hypothetical protein
VRYSYFRWSGLYIESESTSTRTISLLRGCQSRRCVYQEARQAGGNPWKFHADLEKFHAVEIR